MENAKKTMDYACFDAHRGWGGEALEAPRLRLRALRSEDATALVALGGDPDVARHTTRVPHPFTMEDAHRFIERSASRRGGGVVGTEEGYVFAMEKRIDDTLIGLFEIDLEKDGHSAILGYWLGKPYWGHGFATEALKRAVSFAFANLGLERLRAGIHPDNPVSGRVLEKARFSFEGVDPHFPGHDGFFEVPAYRLKRETWQDREAAKPRVLVAAVALIDGDGRVLLSSRPEGKDMAGLWEFPGGKVEETETPEAALVRELREELGIDISQSCLTPLTFASHNYDDFHLLMPLYVCRTWKGVLHPQEGQKLQWVRPVRLADHPMPPADIPLVALLRDFL